MAYWLTHTSMHDEEKVEGTATPEGEVTSPVETPSVEEKTA